MNIEILKLKVSLAEVINEWFNDIIPGSDGWDQLDIPQGDNTAGIMADAAFSVLLAMKDMKECQFQNDMLKED